MDQLGKPRGLGRMLENPASRRTLLSGALLTAAAIASPKRAIAFSEAPSQHVVLLGDSILANGAYVAGGPDVAQQLRERLPWGARATLAAVDGAMTAGVRLQLRTIPADTTHLVVSAGGNDALSYSPVLDDKVRSVGEALERLASVRERFKQDYRTMLDHVLRLGTITAVCTIYDARFKDPMRRRLASAGLTIFNDCITREASARGIALIDLRLICNAEEDMANDIEPSVIGGAKIASGIAKFVSEYKSSKGRSEMFV
jgi:hypothetical protein